MASWHHRAGATWGPDDQNEYEDLMQQAWAGNGESPEVRKDIFLDGVHDGIQAHRLWARDTEREIERRGGWQMLKSWKKSQPKPVQVNHDGAIYLTTPVIGVRRVSADGKVFDQQELFHLCTFDELREKMRTYMVSVAAYERNLHLAVRLLALEDMVELADGSWTPMQACNMLGTTVEEYLLDDGPLAA